MRSVYLLITGLLLLTVVSYGQTIQSSGAGSGNWNDPLSWTPNTVPTAANSSSIIVSHAITVTAAANGDQMVINSGGVLTVNSGITFTVNAGTGDDLTINTGGVLTISSTATVQLQSLPVPPPPRIALLRVFGTINNSGTISNASSATLIFEASSLYNHQYTASPGTIPLASWNLTSTCSIVGYTTNSGVPNNLSQAFGNFTWDTPLLSSFIDLDGALVTVNGNLVFQNIPSDYVYLTSTTDFSLVVGGNFTVNNSFFGFNSLATTSITVGGNMLFSNNGDLNPTFDGNVTINCTGNFEISGGTTNLTYGGAGNIPINVGGNFTLSSSPVINNGGSGSYQLTFNGSGTQTYTASQEMTGYSYLILNGSRVDVPNGSFFSGAGSFTLQGGGTLGVAGVNGLATGTTSGNVRVAGSRNYAANGNIIYNGVTQNLGNEWSTSGALNGVAVNLEIANGAVVTNTNIGSTNLVGILTLTSGTINIGNSNTLTIQGVFNSTASGNFGGSSTSNLSFSGSGAMGNLNFASGSETLNNLTVGRTGTLVLGSNLTIEGTINLSFGNLNFSGRTLTMNGGSISSASTGLISNSTSNLIFGGSSYSGAVPFSGTNQLNNLTFATPGGTFSWASDVTINGNLTLTAGTLTHTSGLTMATNSTIFKGGGSLTSFAPNAVTSYNVNYTGVGNTGLELPTSGSALNNLTINSSGTVTLVTNGITINGNMLISSGIFSVGSNNLTMKGSTWTSSGGFSSGTGTVTFDGTTALAGSPTFNNITVNSTRSLTLTTSTTSLRGNIINNGTINPNSGTVDFLNSTAISGSGTTTFNNLIITGTLIAPTGNMNVAGTWANNGTFTRGVDANTVTFTGTSTITGATQFSGITITGILTSPSTLQVAGHFTNNGTFNSASGTVLFNGTGPQLIQGASLTNFNNITISNPGGPPGVRVASNTDISGVLTLGANVTFDPDGISDNIVFRLRSTGDSPTVDASIASIPASAQVQGKVTVQRYMAIEGSNSARIYRFMSSPVQLAPVSQIQAFIPVTGTFTGASSCSGCGTSQSMFLYNEAVITGDLNTGYENFPASSSTETFAEGRGYTIFVRGNIAPVSSAGSALFELRGDIFSGNRTLPVSFNSSGTPANDGWNLVGNPYPATIDWDAGGWTKSFINNAIYMRDNGRPSPLVASYVGGVGSNGGTQFIAMGQGFFVKSDGGGTPALQVSEAVKVGGTQTTFFREGSIPDLLRITLNQGNLTDEIAVRFHEMATEEFDPMWDAYKLKNAIFNLSSVSGDIKYSINSISPLACANSVQLDISDASAGAYRLGLSGFDSFDEDVNIHLIDQFLGTTIDVKTQSTYDFEITADAASSGSRFKVIFSIVPINNAIAPEGDTGLCVGSEYSFILPTTELGVMYYATLNGTTISENISGTGNSVNIGIDESKLTSGDNTIIVFAKRNSCDPVPLTQSLQIKVESIYAIQSTTGGTSCQPGSVSLSASGAPTNGTYNWYESMTAVEPIAGVSGNLFQTPVLDKSRTYYVSAVNSLGCEGERKEVKAEVLNYDNAAIEEVQYGVLKSNYPIGNAWYFNDILLTGMTGQTINATDAGVYKLEVTIGTCKTSDTFEFVVTGLDENTKGIVLYPNPVDDELELRGLANIKAVSLLSSNGSQLQTIEVRSRSAIKINMRDYSSGLYLVKLIGTNKSVSTYKIMKR